MLIKYPLSLLCSLFLYTINAQPKVNTQHGTVTGYIKDGLHIFKGIPFATPPVGELRWKAPQPAQSWSGVKETTKFAPAPYQGGNPPSGKSEDCLYLNVWSPAKTANENLPVLVWIYGGRFNFYGTAPPLLYWE